jgi:hypothetical protein
MICPLPLSDMASIRTSEAPRSVNFVDSIMALRTKAEPVSRHPGGGLSVGL